LPDLRSGSCCAPVRPDHLHVIHAAELPILRRDIADYLGLPLETVSRIISRLEAEGAVEMIAARPINVGLPARPRRSQCGILSRAAALRAAENPDHILG